MVSAIPLNTIPLNEVDDHAREQANGLAVLCRRDLDDLGLGQRQPERPLRIALLSRLIVMPVQHPGHRGGRADSPPVQQDHPAAAAS
jgi:hypothetical protein